MTNYDYIISGAGCAGLSLVVRMIESGKFTDKKILLIDKAQKGLNDRTWCFWETGAGYFENIVHHRWNSLWAKHPKGDITLNISPYSYKMIRGADFYKHCFSIIKNAPNVKICYEEITAIDAQAGTVKTIESEFAAQYIFSSVLLQPPSLKPTDFYLLQHFKGWWVETVYDAFDPQQADIMNFRTSQKHGCTFLYVLPTSKRRALVEYTLFTEDVLQQDEYEQGLKTFITEELKIANYHITETEYGIIPMTNYRFPQQDGKLFFIGTAGGQTKASTGYTFQFIQKHSAAIVKNLISTQTPVTALAPAKYGFYDSVLLRVLHERKLSGADLFYRMFQKNKASLVFHFLDNETSLLQDLMIMNRTDKSIFIPAAMKELML